MATLSVVNIRSGIDFSDEINGDLSQVRSNDKQLWAVSEQMHQP